MNFTNAGVLSGNVCVSKAGLTAGTTTTITSANAVTFAIGGVLYTKAAASNEATPTTDAATGAAFKAIPVGSESVFALCRDAAGALKAVQGDVGLISDDYGVRYQTVPDTLAVIGTLKVEVGSTGSAWTFGASNTASATGVTCTFTDRMFLPSVPA